MIEQKSFLQELGITSVAPDEQLPGNKWITIASKDEIKKEKEKENKK